jgi:PDZ domain
MAFGATIPIPYDYDKGVFEITDVSLKSNTYSTEIIGFIKNVDPNLNTIEGVSLTLEMYDKNNHLIGVDTAYPVTQNFRPDQKSPFKFSSIDKDEDLHHIHIGILATDWGTAVAPYTPPDLSSGTNRTFTDCYSDAAKDLYSRSLILPTKLRLNVTDPEINKTMTNMCNFYHEKSGSWVNVSDIRYNNIIDQYSQEFSQKYYNTFPESFKQFILYRPPLIGIIGISLTPDLSKQIGLNQTKGFLITSITKDSPADKSGLRSGSTTVTYNGSDVEVGGDVILKIDNQSVSNISDITTYVTSQKHVGDKIHLTILRDNATKELDLILGQTPNQPMSQNDNKTQEELYNECVNVAGKSLCDFLFKRNDLTPGDTSNNSALEDWQNKHCPPEQLVACRPPPGLEVCDESLSDAAKRLCDSLFKK